MWVSDDVFYKENREWMLCLFIVAIVGQEKGRVQMVESNISNFSKYKIQQSIDWWIFI